MEKLGNGPGLVYDRQTGLQNAGTSHVVLLQQGLPTVTPRIMPCEGPRR